MRAIQYPSWWSGASFTAKAAWLVYSHHAGTFSAACTMLRKKPAVRSVRPSVAQYQAGLRKLNLE